MFCKLNEIVSTQSLPQFNQQKKSPICCAGADVSPLNVKHTAHETRDCKMFW